MTGAGPPTLRRKQNVPDSTEWSRLLTPDAYPDLDALLDRTVDQARQYAHGRRVAYGWSGGKDSIALHHVMGLAGVTECVLVISRLEYPEFLAWVTDNMPDDLTVILTGQDHAWLRAHPRQLFPAGNDATVWFRGVQHAGQTRYFRLARLHALAVGRRRADGNYTGTDGTGEYVNRLGVRRWAPLVDWPHEAILALIAREQLPMPPVYDWPRGYQVGTGPWPARQWCESREHGWREVWQIDPDVVRLAADENIPGARDHLDQARD